MTMQSLTATISGVSPLILANPQAVSKSNSFKKAMTAITDKRRGKTDADLDELADLEVASRMYFDDALGVYVPAQWVLASIAYRANAAAKIGKGKIRGAVFMPQSGKLKLNYRGMKKVSKLADVVKNAEFRHSMILPQKGVRIEKTMPIFHDWSFSVDIEYDDSVLNKSTLKLILEQSARYVGFGDFRPTFGRATAEFLQ